MKFKKYVNTDLEKILKKHKRKQDGLSPFSYLNPDAGDVEKGIEFFNHASGGDSNTCEGNSEGGESMSMGESYRQSELEQKKEIFEKIKSLNPNASFKTYEKMSIGRMLAIYNSYKDKFGKIKLKDKEIEDDTKLPEDRDVYFNKSKGDYMIHGLNLKFETEKAALNFARELRREEKNYEK